MTIGKGLPISTGFKDQNQIRGSGEPDPEVLGEDRPPTQDPYLEETPQTSEDQVVEGTTKIKVDLKKWRTM